MFKIFRVEFLVFVGLQKTNALLIISVMTMSSTHTTNKLLFYDSLRRKMFTTSPKTKLLQSRWNFSILKLSM